MNGRGPPCGGGRGPLTGNGPGLGNPCWGGGLSCGVVVPAGGLHFVGSGGIDFTPPSGHWPVPGLSAGEAHLDGTGVDCGPRGWLEYPGNCCSCLAVISIPGF